MKGGFVLADRRHAKKLTKQLASQISEMLHSGKTELEIRKILDLNNQNLWQWITLAVFGLPDQRTPELEILRDAIFDALLGETLLRKVLEASSETLEKKTKKVTTLLNLTKTEAAALERKGNATFVEEFEGSAVTLKVEETIEIIPPAVSLLEKLMKIAEGNASVKNAVLHLTPFGSVDRELEDEV